LPRYIVLIDEHVYLHDLSPEPPRLAGRPDLAVATGPALATRALGATGVLEAPAHVGLPALDMERVSYLEVRDRIGRELVAVVELLSPSNKQPGRGREAYLAKRAEIQASPAHLVEIDLLRGGMPLPATDRPPCTDSVLVSRADRRPRADFWPIGLRDPLPIIPVPLRAGDGDARLDLRAALNRVYDESGYHYYLYQDEPDPPLASDDDAWARPLLPRNPDARPA
jgi:hypothetical protein